MTVSILIISHHEVGNALLNAAKTTLHNNLPLCISTVEVQPDSDPETLIPELKRIIRSLDQGDGVLILTDLFGATPSNIAQELPETVQISTVTGLNLPMLLRVLNYPNLSLGELSQKAYEGGLNGIKQCKCQDK